MLLAPAIANLELLRMMTVAREAARQEGLLQAGAGREALAVIADCLEARDLLFPDPVDLALRLASGMTVSELAEEFRNGGGRPPAAGWMAAVGAAWACQLEREDRITVLTVSEMREGNVRFAEALRMARQRRLPLVIVAAGRHDPGAVPALDGRRPGVIRKHFEEAACRVRSGEGPVVLCVEFADRPDALSDPILLLRDELIGGAQLTWAEWGEQTSQIASAVERAYCFARRDDRPLPCRGSTGIPVHHRLGPGRFWRTDEAVEHMLATMLAEDSRLVVLGKSGMLGGRFPERVIPDLGWPHAAGFGAAGYRVVCELGGVPEPATVPDVAVVGIVRAPFGEHLAGFGGRVAAAPGPAEAAAMLHAALAAGDPLLLLLGEGGEVVDRDECESPFRVKVRLTGRDLSLASWGVGVGAAHAAARRLRLGDIEGEVVDLRMLKPVDWKGVEASVARTSRLIVVDGGGGFGRWMLSELARQPEVCRHLRVPPRLAPADPDAICEAAREALER